MTTPTTRTVAINAVAHKLAPACYYVLRDQVRFEVNKAFALTDKFRAAAASSLRCWLTTTFLIGRRRIPSAMSWSVGFPLMRLLCHGTTKGLDLPLKEEPAICESGPHGLPPAYDEHTPSIARGRLH